MRIIHPVTRAIFRELQIIEIKRTIRREYRTRIRGAATRAEKKGLKTQRDSAIAKAIGPLIRERRRFNPPAHCQNCDYDLTGNVSGICPECGTEVGRR